MSKIPLGFIVMPSRWKQLAWQNDPLQAEADALDFCLKVEYRGGGRYAITRGYSRQEYTHDGEVIWQPREEELDECRWNSLDEAVAFAENIVDTVVINGRTYAQWAKHFSQE